MDWCRQIRAALAVGADVISSSILDCHTDVATDEVREASQSHAFDSPMPGEYRGESHATSTATWTSNIVASADTGRYRLARERSKIAQRSGGGRPAAKQESGALRDERHGQTKKNRLHEQMIIRCS
jgi:hypothetical protein